MRGRLLPGQCRFFQVEFAQYPEQHLVVDLAAVAGVDEHLAFRVEHVSGLPQIG